jgi:hypothetical protein
MAIEEALAQARVELLGKPGIVGISHTADRIIVYAEEGTTVPTSIMGVPVEIIYTKRFKIL